MSGEVVAGAFVGAFWGGAFSLVRAVVAWAGRLGAGGVWDAGGVLVFGAVVVVVALVAIRASR